MDQWTLNRKRWNRYTPDGFVTGEKNPVGRIFAKTGAREVDLSDVRFIHAGVDTVQQFYAGSIKREWHDLMDRHEYGDVIRLRGLDFRVGTAGASGFRYFLQNDELGLLIFYDGKFTPKEEEPQHCMVRCSPHFLHGKDAEAIQADMDMFADEIIHGKAGYNFCDTHICVDSQGWKPSDDFVGRLTTRSQLVRQYVGMSNIKLAGSEAVQVYGERETMTFGQKRGLQFSVYRKDLAMQRQDTYDLWKRVYDDPDWIRGGSASAAWLPDAEIWRIEARFHRSVIKQFSQGMNKRLDSFLAVSEHLTDLWVYALGIFRLDHGQNAIDPFWQLLIEDIEFGSERSFHGLKRVYKTESTPRETRNVCLVIGNSLSLYARRGMTARQCIKKFRASGMWKIYCRYCADRDVDPAAEIHKGLAERRLRGGGTLVLGSAAVRQAANCS